MGILGEVIQNAKGGGVLIPIIFLGIQADSSFLKLVREKLGEQSAFLSKEGFFAGEEGLYFLICEKEIPFLDAGGGLVVLGENFSAKNAPAHLMRATCIYPFRNSEAQNFVKESGLEKISCGDCFGTVVLSGNREQTMVTLQRNICTLSGSVTEAGDFPITQSLFEKEDSVSVYELLAYTAIMLLIGRKDLL